MLDLPARAPSGTDQPPAPPPRGRRVPLGALLGLAISVISLGGVVWWALRQEPPEFPSSPGDLGLLGLAIALYGVATLARGWRWHGILRRAGVRHNAADAYELVPVGYMGNTVLPARGGEVLRMFLLAGRSDARRREVLGTIVSERVLDAATLAVMFVVLTWVGVAGTPVGQRPAMLAVAGMAAVGVALYVYLALRRRGRMERFAAAIRPVVSASKPLLGSAGLVLGAATAVVWLIEGAIFWLVAESLSLDIGLLEGCFLLVITAFFSLIPAAPGYVGTFDAAVVFGLKSLSITGGPAVAFALLVRFVLFFPITIGGLGLLIGRYGGLRQLRRARRAEETVPGRL